MACPHSKCSAVRFLGWACVVLGLLPYYSKTTRTSAGEERTAIGVDLPMLGERNFSPGVTDTLIRVGIPCSPLFVYEEVFENAKPPQTITVTSQDGKGTTGGRVTVQGAGHVRMTTINYRAHWAFHYASWSMTALVAGLLVLIVSRRRRGAKQPPVDEALGDVPQAG